MIVTVEQLEKIAALIPEEEPRVHRNGNRNGTGQPFDVEKFISAFVPEVGGPIPWNGGRKWRGKQGEPCPCGGAHDASGFVILEFPSGAWTARCLHNSGSDFDHENLRKRDLDYNPTWQSNGNGKSHAATGPNEASTQSEGAHAANDHPWPVLDHAAYHGIAGDFVRMVEPHSEADPAALLLQFMVMAGNVIGRGPHRVADGALHYTNLFVVLVGTTSAGRKGTAYARTIEPFKLVDEFWAPNCHASGLSSGEGLIWRVRDPIEKREPIKERGRFTGEYQTYEADPGVADKRLVAYEPEFARTLKVCARETNILSTVIRQGWDTATSAR